MFFSLLGIFSIDFYNADSLKLANIDLNVLVKSIATEANMQRTYMFALALTLIANLTLLFAKLGMGQGKIGTQIIGLILAYAISLRLMDKNIASSELWGNICVALTCACFVIYVLQNILNYLFFGRRKDKKNETA